MDKTTVDVHGRYIIPCCVVSCRHIYIIMYSLLRLMHGIAIYRAWAFCVVRLDDLGNAKASEVGWAKSESRAFFVRAQLN